MCPVGYTTLSGSTPVTSNAVACAGMFPEREGGNVKGVMCSSFDVACVLWSPTDILPLFCV